MKKKYNNRKKHTILKELSVNRKKKKYIEEDVIVLIKKFKKNKDINIRNEIFEYCYPIIFSILSNIGRKINTNNKLLDNEDFFNECILIINNCINNYNQKKNVKFLTFMYVALYRSTLRYINVMVLKQERFFIYQRYNDYDDIENDDYTINKNKKDNFSNEYFNEYEFIDFKNDFKKKLDIEEIKVLYLKIADYDYITISKIMNINVSKYYRILNNIKNKMKDII